MSSSTDYSKQDFISRDELNRILEIGVDELLREATQTGEEIFSEVILIISENDIEKTKIARERLEARESYSNRLSALKKAVNIMELNIQILTMNLSQLFLKLLITNLDLYEFREILKERLNSHRTVTCFFVLNS